MSWRKPVGGLLASASLAEGAACGCDFSRPARRRTRRMPGLGPWMVRPSSRIEIAIRVLSVGSSSHLPIVSRHSPAGQAMAVPDAVNSMGVGLQACGREHVLDLFGHAVHVRRGGVATPVVPHHPGVDVRGRNGLPAAVASKREPGKLGRRRPGRLDGELDHPPHQRLDDHRDDRADLPGRRGRRDAARSRWDSRRAAASRSSSAFRASAIARRTTNGVLRLGGQQV